MQGRPARDGWTGGALDEAFRVNYPEYVFYLMLQLVRRRETALSRAMQPLGLTAAKWHAGAVLMQHGPCSMAEFAHLLAVDRTTLTRTMDGLVSDGLVERGAAPGDRRKVLLSLTERGAAVIERARAVSRALNEGVLDGAPEEDWASAMRLLRHVVSTMIPDDEVAWGVLTFTPPGRR